MSKWILIVIYDINIWLLITPPLHQTGDNGWQCRAELRNDTPLHCEKNKLSLQKNTRRKVSDH